MKKITLTTYAIFVALVATVLFVGCRKEKIEGSENIGLDKNRKGSLYGGRTLGFTPYLVGMDMGFNDEVYFWESSNVVTVGWVDKICGKYSEYFIDGYHADVLAMSVSGLGEGYVWYNDGTYSKGISYDYLRDIITNQPYTLPLGKVPANIVGIAFQKSNNHCFAFYDDGTFSEGTPSVLDAYSGLQSYSIAPGESYSSIIDVAISNVSGRFYVWYNDNKMSVGTSTDLDYYEPLKSMKNTCGEILLPVVGIDIGTDDGVYFWKINGQVSKGVSTNTTGIVQSYVLPYSKIFSQVIDMAISNSGKGYVWYSDGTMSVGYGLYNFGDFVLPKPYLLPYGKTPADIVGIAIQKSDDHCFAFYRDGTFSEGNSTDLGAYVGLQSYSISPYEDYDSIKDIGIAASSGKFYVWFADDKMSVGSKYNLNDFIPLKPMEQ